MSDDQKEKEGLSRRQFLTYALGGTGAFMAASIAMPMIPFVTDPLRRTGGGDFVQVGKVADFEVGQPKRVEFKVHKKDGWVQSDAQLSAWILKKQDGSILAMSPICTHLGCQINGASADGGPAKDGEYFFHCPCHDSFFTKDGIPKPGVPATRPLDVYTVDQDALKNGILSIGAVNQRKS